MLARISLDLPSKGIRRGWSDDTQLQPELVLEGSEAVGLVLIQRPTVPLAHSYLRPASVSHSRSSACHSVRYLVFEPEVGREVQAVFRLSIPFPQPLEQGLRNKLTCLISSLKNKIPEDLVASRPASNSVCIQAPPSVFDLPHSSTVQALGWALPCQVYAMLGTKSKANTAN